MKLFTEPESQVTVMEFMKMDCTETETKRRSVLPSFLCVWWRIPWADCAVIESDDDRRVM